MKELEQYINEMSTSKYDALSTYLSNNYKKLQYKPIDKFLKKLVVISNRRLKSVVEQYFKLKYAHIAAKNNDFVEYIKDNFYDVCSEIEKNDKQNNELIKFIKSFFTGTYTHMDKSENLETAVKRIFNELNNTPDGDTKNYLLNCLIQPNNDAENNNFYFYKFDSDNIKFNKLFDIPVGIYKSAFFKKMIKYKQNKEGNFEHLLNIFFFNTTKDIKGGDIGVINENGEKQIIEIKSESWPIKSNGCNSGEAAETAFLNTLKREVQKSITNKINPEDKKSVYSLINSLGNRKYMQTKMGPNSRGSVYKCMFQNLSTYEAFHHEFIQILTQNNYTQDEIINIYSKCILAAINARTFNSLKSESENIINKFSLKNNEDFLKNPITFFKKQLRPVMATCDLHNLLMKDADTNRHIYFIIFNTSDSKNQPLEKAVSFICVDFSDYINQKKNFTDLYNFINETNRSFEFILDGGWGMDTEQSRAVRLQLHIKTE